MLESLTTHIKNNPDDLKFKAHQANGVYCINTNEIKQLASANGAITRKQQKKNAKRILRDETTQFKTLAALVLYWHENLGHVGADTMVNIVTNKANENIPTELTLTFIRKYFPSTCTSCPIGNLTLRPPTCIAPANPKFKSEMLRN